MSEYQYGGARVLVEMHAEALREFMTVWRQADAQEVRLPATSDPNYASREALLTHVLGCAARYLTWICAQLEIPVPELEEHPPVEGFTARADESLEKVLDAWRGPLEGLTEDRAYRPTHTSRWGTPYCIDAMLEHAVMHPIRHGRQLKGLMAGSATSA